MACRTPSLPIDLGLVTVRQGLSRTIVLYLRDSAGDPLDLSAVGFGAATLDEDSAADPIEAYSDVDTGTQGISWDEAATDPEDSLPTTAVTIQIQRSSTIDKLIGQRVGFNVAAIAAGDTDDPIDAAFGELEVLANNAPLDAVDDGLGDAVLEGEVTITGTNTTAAVTFAEAVSAATYVPTFGVGDADIDVGTPRYSNRTTAGFDVVIPTAPGTGRSVTIGWNLREPD